MGFVSRFMPQKVTVCPRIVQPLVRCAASFAYRKRNGAVWKASFNSRYYSAQAFICEKHVFPTLEHKRAKAKPVAFFAALHDIAFAKSVPPRFFIVPLQPAVIAVVFAVARKFYEAAEINLSAIIRFPQIFRAALQGQKFRRPGLIEEVMYISCKFAFGSRVEIIRKLERRVFVHFQIAAAPQHKAKVPSRIKAERDLYRLKAMVPEHSLSARQRFAVRCSPVPYMPLLHIKGRYKIQ